MNTPSSKWLLAAVLLLAGCEAQLAEVTVGGIDETAEAEEEIRFCRSGSPRLSDRSAGQTPLLSASDVSVLASLEYPPGNVAAAADGRVFLSLFPDTNFGPVKVGVLDASGALQPYPSAAFQEELKSVLGIRMDRHGRLWVLDHGKLGLHRPRLYAFDVQSNAKVVDVTFDSKVAGFGSILNDVQISPDGLTAYISDASIVAGKPAILVVELGGPKPTVRRVLEKHASVMQGDFDVYVNGTKAKFAGLLCAGAGVDGIALDGAGTYLYYTALNSGWLYRVPTAALRDASQSPAPFVEQFAPSTMSDGMISDLAGNVYLTDMEHSQVVRVKPDRSLEVVATDAKMRWPDGLSWTADGALLLTNSAIHQTMSDLIRTRNGIKSRGPYHVLRLGLGGGIVGQ